MSNSENLSFVSAAYYDCYYNAANHNIWSGANNYTLYCGREGANNGGSYLCSKLEFSTKGLGFLQGQTLTLTITSFQQTGNFGRISAILSEKELTGPQVYNITTDEDIMNTDGVIMYTNCKNAPNIEDRIAPLNKAVFEFNASEINSEKTYFIYLKRRIGLANAAETPQAGGFSAFINPIVEPNMASIVLEYFETPTWPGPELVTITPDLLNLEPYTSLTQNFKLIQLDNSDSGLSLSNTTISWECQAFNEKNEEIQDNQIENAGDGNFIFNNVQPGYKFIIKAVWGSQSAKYEKRAYVNTIIKWKGLESWIFGYNSALLGLPPFSTVREHIANEYKGHILPLFEANDKKYVAISRDDIAMTTYHIYIASKKFEYNSIDEQCQLNKDENDVLIGYYQVGKEFNWRISKYDGDIKTIGFAPLWVNKDLRDEYRNSTFFTYEPKKIFR